MIRSSQASEVLLCARPDADAKMKSMESMAPRVQLRGSNAARDGSSARLVASSGLILSSGG